MKTSIAIVCFLASISLALAQSGVSNQRYMYGNLVRDSSTYSPRGVNQGPVNNGPIKIAPVQPSTSNAGKTQTISR
jgi:hypothetical protein